MKGKKDNLYMRQGSSAGSFKFDRDVAAVFEDMISRSVPGYEQIISLIPTLTRCFNFPDHNYYDLGSSLGAGMLAMAEGLTTTPCTIWGIDNSAPMIEKSRPTLDRYTAEHGTRFELDHADILDSDMHTAAMVLMNFTLQFIAPAKRETVIGSIHQALVPGGILVLSEKVKYADEHLNQTMTDIHHQFKADQGYSRLEISQKRDAIEDVLRPETLETHLERLTAAGFSKITPWIQNLQFVSILAIK